MAIDDLKNKRRNQGGQGNAGTTLGSPDGIGIKKRYSKPQDNPVVNSFLIGVDELGNRITDKGIIGTFSEANQNYNKYITDKAKSALSGTVETGGKLLFGKNFVNPLESSKTLDDITSSRQSSIPQPTKVEKSIPQPTKVEKSIPKIPQQFTSSVGNTTLTHTPQLGQIGIDLGNNRKGSISFLNESRNPVSQEAKDAYQKQLDSLTSRIAFNNSPEGQASFARNAQLSNQRDQEYLDQVRLKNLAEQEAFNSAAQYSVDQSNLANLSPSLREQTNEGVIRGRADSLLRKGGFGRSGTALLEAAAQPETLREQQRQSTLAGISNREQLAAQREQAKSELTKQILSGQSDQQRLALEARKYAGQEALGAAKLTVDQQKAASEEARTRLGGVLDLIKSGQLNPNQGAAIFKNQGGSLNINTASIFLPDKVAQELASIPTPKDKLNFLGDYFSKDIAEEIINNSYQ